MGTQPPFLNHHATLAYMLEEKTPADAFPGSTTCLCGNKLILDDKVSFRALV